MSPGLPNADVSSHVAYKGTESSKVLYAATVDTKPEPSPPYLIGSVDKALTVLRLLRDRGPTGVSELGAELDVARSTAHRILGTLMHHGFVEQDRLTRAYRLGPFLTGLGVETAATVALRDLAMPHLLELSRAFRETVQLMVLEGANSRFVDGVSGDRPLNTTVRAGTIIPAHATAGGKVLLAELTDDDVRSLFRAGLEGITGRTIPTMPKLLHQLAAIRERGYSVNDGESEDGISAVAVTVRRASGTAAAAIALSMPSVRMHSENVPTMVNELRECAAAIENDLLSTTP
jgi:DNA-binding IclR family transcriptional regulator